MTARASAGRTTVRVLWQVVCWTSVVLAVGVVTVAVLVPRLAGATPYTVLTGSMQPSYPPGTLVVVRPTAAEDIAVGDVVTYQRESGGPTVVTHRVVGVATGTVDAEPVLTTQGDANAVADAAPVLPVQVRGELWYAVPWIGRLNALVSGRPRLWATYGVGAALLVYAAAMAAGGVADRRRARAS